MDQVALGLGGKNKPNRLAQLKEHAKAMMEKATSSSSKITKQPTFQEIFGLETILKDWTTAVGDIIGFVIHQGDRDICWAICFARLLQAIYNLEHPNDQISFSFEDLVGSLKQDETRGLALTNLKRAFRYISGTGMLKNPTKGIGKAGDKGKRVQENFGLFEDVDANFIQWKLDSFPVALLLVIEPDLSENKGAIYYLPEKRPLTPVCRSHSLLLIGCGMTKDRKLYFIGQNSWGNKWGCQGYVRIVIDYPCDIICRIN